MKQFLFINTNNKNNNKDFSTEMFKLSTILFEVSAYQTLRGIQKDFRWRFSACSNFYYFRNTYVCKISRISILLILFHNTKFEKKKQELRQIKFIFKINFYFLCFHGYSNSWPVANKVLLIPDFVINIYLFLMLE
jgi:hypothetical protein